MAVVAPQQTNATTNFHSRHMSFEDFLAWDGDGNPELRVEWVNGEVVQMVSIDLRHTLISNFLIKLIGLASDLSQIGILLSDPFVMRPAIDGNGRSPDVVLVLNEHKEWIARRVLNGPADIVIEIVSPGGIKTDYMVKAAEYRRAGVPEYWIIDPLEQQTTFLLLEGEEYIEGQFTSSGMYESPGLNGLPVDPVWFNQDPLPDVLGILREWGIIPTA